MAKPLQISRTNAIFRTVQEFAHSLGRFQSFIPPYLNLLTIKRQLLCNRPHPLQWPFIAPHHISVIAK